MEPLLHIPDKSTAPPRDFPLPPVLRLFWVWMFVLSAISAVAGDIYYRSHRFRDCCTLAYDDPLFVDFWHYSYIFRFFHTSAFFHNAERFAYPAFSAVLYDGLYHLGPHSQAIFLSTELAACILAAALFFQKIRGIGLRLFPAATLVVCTLVFSHPLLYMFQSGTVEIVTCILTAAGLWASLKNHNNSAAVLWAAAAALKLYPLVLLAVFLSRAKWRALLLGVSSFVLISVLAMWFVGPSIPAAFAGSVSGVSGFVSTYAGKAKIEELPIDHSLLAPVKLFVFIRAHRSGSIAYLTKPYLLIAGTLALFAFFLRARYMPVANQLIFLFVAMIALPPVSYDYTLVHLYALWAMLVIICLRAGQAGRHIPGLSHYFLCFAVLFTSQRYIFHHGISANGTFKAIALVIMVITALRYPIPDQAVYELLRRTPS